MSISLSTFYVIINLFVVVVLASIPFIFFSVYADSPQVWRITILEGSAEQNHSPWFYPDELPFEEGDTIVWMNKDSVTHSISSGLPGYSEQAGLFFKTGKIEPHKSAYLSLEKSDFNAYYYFCELHPWMTGKIFFSDEKIAQPETKNPILIEQTKSQSKEVLTIKGQVHSDFAKSDYKIFIYDQDNNLVDFSLGKFNDDASYTLNQNIDERYGEKHGKYLVRLVYGLPSKVAQTSFEFENMLENTSTSSPLLPSWIKKVSGFWCDDKITDSEFLIAIDYLVEENIILVEPSSNSITASTIPSWIKNNACWWSNNQLSNSEFIPAIQFLLKSGIIRI